MLFLLLKWPIKVILSCFQKPQVRFIKFLVRSCCIWLQVLIRTRDLEKFPICQFSYLRSNKEKYPLFGMTTVILRSGSKTRERSSVKFVRIIYHTRIKVTDIQELTLRALRGDFLLTIEKIVNQVQTLLQTIRPVLEVTDRLNHLTTGNTKIQLQV